MAKKNVFTLPPKIYGLSYLCSIPAFAFIYRIFDLSHGTGGKAVTFIEALYFSAVTITTLGYGDVIPKGIIGQLLAGFEAVFGITLIGLFLTAISVEISKKTASNDREIEHEKYNKSELSKLFGHYSLLVPKIGIHFALLRSLIELSEPPVDTEGKVNKTVPKTIETIIPKIEDYPFNKFNNIFFPCLLEISDFRKPWMLAYIENESDILGGIETIVKSVDLREFPELQIKCLALLRNNGILDYSDKLTGSVDFDQNNPKMREVVVKMMTEWEGPVEMMPMSNLINPYIAFFHTVKFRSKTIYELSELIEKLNIPIHNPKPA